ncbi:hypothetical protein D3C78_658660 [compost metagenome]
MLRSKQFDIILRPSTLHVAECLIIFHYDKSCERIRCKRYCVILQLTTYILDSSIFLNCINSNFLLVSNAFKYSIIQSQCHAYFSSELNRSRLLACIYTGEAEVVNIAHRLIS